MLHVHRHGSSPSSPKKSSPNKRNPLEEYRARQAASSAKLPSGILNSANDCFCNSVLQSLTATSALESLVLCKAPSSSTLKSPALTNGRDVAGDAGKEWVEGMTLNDTFLQFMENAYRNRDSGQKPSMNPRELIRRLGAKYDQYLDFRQQDAHELLRHLLDGMHMEEMDIIKKRQPPKSQDRTKNRILDSTASLSSDSDATSRSQETQGDSALESELEPKLTPFVDTVFGGRLASFIVCDACKHVSHTYEDFMDLSLPIKGDEERKRNRLKAFAQIFKTSTANDAPKPPLNAAAILQAAASGPAESKPAASLAGGEASGASLAREGSTLTPKKKPSEEKDLSARIGRRLSIGMGRSKDRFQPAAAPPQAKSSPTSLERSSTLDHLQPLSTVNYNSRSRSVASRPTSKVPKPHKPTAQETAYRHAILRDEPISSINPLSLLRNSSIPSSSSSAGPSNHQPPKASASQLWMKLGAGQAGLIDCLRMFTSVEVMEGDNSFACRNCWKLENPLLAMKDKAAKTTTTASTSADTFTDVGGDDTKDSEFRLKIDSPVVVGSTSSSPGPTASRTPPSQHISISEPALPLENAEDTRSFAIMPPIVEPAEDATDEKNVVVDDDAHRTLAPVAFPTSVDTPSQEKLSLATGGFSIPEISTTAPETPTGTPATPVPRYRRFSSYNTEKFLSPNASRDSLVSAPSEKIHQTRQWSGYKSDGERSAAVSDVDSDTESIASASSVMSRASSTVAVDDKAESGIPPTPVDPAAPTAKSKADARARAQLRSEQVIHRRAFKRYLIDSPPPVLVIHLKRFQQVNRTPVSFFGNFKKLDEFVPFPEYLDLRPFLAPKKEYFGLDAKGRSPKGPDGKRAHSHGRGGHWKFPGSGSSLGGVKEADETPVPYRLYAVVVHIGSMLGGHYIAYVALPSRPPPSADAAEPKADAEGKPSSPGSEANVAPQHPPPSTERQWCYTSDTTVRTATLDEVLKTKAYLCFYERV